MVCLNVHKMIKMIGVHKKALISSQAHFTNNSAEKWKFFRLIWVFNFGFRVDTTDEIVIINVE